MNIVLYEPEIPANTGNIGRTCAATGTRLHLIEPLGFRLGEKELRRAGMDYWHKLDVSRYINWADFLEKIPGRSFILQRQRPGRFIRRRLTGRTVIWCSARRARGFRRRF